jgi:hypothetical protein
MTTVFGFHVRDALWQSGVLRDVRTEAVKLLTHVSWTYLSLKKVSKCNKAICFRLTLGVMYFANPCRLMEPLHPSVFFSHHSPCHIFASSLSNNLFCSFILPLSLFFFCLCIECCFVGRVITSYCVPVHLPFSFDSHVTCRDRRAAHLAEEQTRKRGKKEKR